MSTSDQPETPAIGPIPIATGNCEQLDKLPLEPIYKQDSPNDPIDFGSFQILAQNKLTNEPYQTTAKAQLRLVPSDSLEITVPCPNEWDISQRFRAAFTTNFHQANNLSLPDHGVAFPAYLRSFSGERAIYFPSLSPIQVRPKSNSICRVIFHLFNWPDFSGPNDFILRTGTPPLQGARRCGRVGLCVGNWRITLVATKDCSERLKALDSSGGFIITHVGQLERVDGAPFSTNQVDEIISLLFYFFSFVLGRWSLPALSVGFDDTGKRAYEEWGIGKVSEGDWTGSNSWFDRHHSQFFAAVLPGFSELWNKNVWRDSLNKSIYWYVTANKGSQGLGVDSALLFSQAALEVMSWTYCVLDRKLISKGKFEKQSAAGNIRLLLSSLGIPTQIPQELSALDPIKPGERLDSADAITKLRNGLVHPKKTEKIREGAFYDAWRLSLWLIDLIILRLCNYNGRYANRLTGRFVGQVELVPWAS